MKKVLLILLILAFSFTSHAWDYRDGIKAVITAKKSGGAGSCADSSCSGFLVCQNFEGTGYDNSESWTESCGSGATCDEDYSASPLRGAQSYKFTTGTSNSNVTIDYSAIDEVYFFVRLTIENDQTGTIFIIRSTNTNLFTIGYSSGLNSLVYNGATGGAAVTLGTTYYIWGYYTKGTGANEINRAWVSTTSTKPETADYEITNGSNTEQANRGLLYDSANGTGSRFDQVLISTTEIGDVCE